MGFILSLIGLAIHIFILIIIIQVIVSWLIAFDVINENNEQAQNLMGLLHRATDPVFKPVRKYVPPVGGIDLTPLIVIVALTALESLLYSLLG